MPLNNLWITEEIKEEMKKYLEKNESEGTIIQNLEDVAKAAKKKKVYSNAILPQEIRKTTNNLTLHLKLEKEEQNPKLLEGNKS